MRGTRCNGSNSGLLWGGFLIVLGIIILLEHLGIVPPIEFYRFWPLILVLIGLTHLLRRGQRATGMMWIAIGTVFQLQQLGIAHVSWGDIWPVVLIVAGIIMIWGTFERRALPPVPGGDASSSLNELAVFSGVERRITSQHFQGGRITAVFGGIELDLRQADIEGDSARIHMDAVFGGCEIRVPESWIIDARGQGIFGGYSDNTRQDGGNSASTEKRKTLILTGSAVFGGVEIRN